MDIDPLFPSAKKLALSKNNGKRDGLFTLAAIYLLLQLAQAKGWTALGQENILISFFIRKRAEVAAKTIGDLASSFC